MLAKMTNEEKAKLVTEFRCSLFEDLPIKLAEVFEPYKIHYKTKVFLLFKKQ